MAFRNSNCCFLATISENNTSVHVIIHQRLITHLPDFLQATHCDTLFVAVSSIAEVVESASQTGVVENGSHPSATPDMRPHTLHAPVERHL